jgi:hypothetical protein|uniref:Uncharacterized protein n=1 Tax=Zea mays TaxID=4577 RepID=A0A804Q783_MAIZE
MVLQQHVSLDILPNTWHERGGSSETKQGKVLGLLGAISKGVGEEITGGGAAPPKRERGCETRAFPGHGREEKKGGTMAMEEMELLRRATDMDLTEVGPRSSCAQGRKAPGCSRSPGGGAGRALGLQQRGAASGPYSLSSTMGKGASAPWTAEGRKAPCREEGLRCAMDRARWHGSLELMRWLLLS